MKIKKRIVLLLLVPVLAGAGIILSSCAAEKKETPSIPREKIIPLLDSLRDRLQLDLFGKTGTDVGISIVRDSTGLPDADSVVHYDITVVKPLRYYGIKLTVSYFATTKKAKAAFEAFFAEFRNRNTGEGMLPPESHYRIGNCIADLDFGCALSQTNTEKIFAAFFERLYHSDEAANSFIVNDCGGGNRHSKDLD